MRKVFLDDLPRHNGKNNKIDWKKSTGYTINFTYEDINGQVTIIDYYIKNKRGYLDIKYNDNIISIGTNNFYNCRFGELLGKITKEYTYNINQIIENKQGKIQILKQIKINNVKNYEYQCLIDGYIGKVTEYSLNSGTSCPVCAGKKVLKGTNDLWTTNCETAKLLKYQEIGYEISRGSQKYQIFVCSNCGFEKSLITKNVVNAGFGCPKCSDGLSYPNKFMFNFLEQIIKLGKSNNFEIEKGFNWLLYEFKGKLRKGRLDGYFEVNDKAYGIEMDGEFHTKDNLINGQTKEESKYIDDEKDKLCKEHNIEIIRINCDESKLEWIKNNIMRSKLSQLLNFKVEDIDWLKCHEYACNSLVKIVCDYWNNGINSTLSIAKELKLNQHTIINYLKQGSELGWCDYDHKKVLINNNRIQGIIQGKKRSKEVIQLSKNGEFIKKWESATEIQRRLGISQSNISGVCRGERKLASGFKWMYKEDYEHYIKDKNNNINE